MMTVISGKRKTLNHKNKNCFKTFSFLLLMIKSFFALLDEHLLREIVILPFYLPFHIALELFCK